jgi:hypothetical protein
MASMIAIGWSGGMFPLASRRALTHRGLNLSVRLTESTYQQAFTRHFRIILASSYEIVSNVKLA